MFIGQLSIFTVVSYPEKSNLHWMNMGVLSIDKNDRNNDVHNSQATVLTNGVWEVFSISNSYSRINFAEWVIFIIVIIIVSLYSTY